MNNQQPAGEAQNSQKKKPFYKRWWFITIAAIVVLSAIFGSLGDKKDKAKNNTQPVAEVKQEENQNQPTQEVKQKSPTPQVAAKKIPYEVVLEWSIPNGGKGERIIIDQKYLNFEDMTALGDTLKEDLKNERNALAFVHTDKKSAELQGKMLENPTKSEMDYVGKHYVGNYTKNANSKFHEFTIFLNGIDDTSEATNKIISY